MKALTVAAHADVTQVTLITVVIPPVVAFIEIGLRILTTIPAAHMNIWRFSSNLCLYSRTVNDENLCIF